jgi:hypothetical protein
MSRAPTICFVLVLAGLLPTPAISQSDLDPASTDRVAAGGRLLEDGVGGLQDALGEAGAPLP